ncbi:Glycosyl-hydrolase 97 N-terminal [Caldanaerobius fijiensis DSM 17918]|uniref:Glycosyl-hydrolase 97 N-terminal n=1 Tax=Caldanaerobius fijiensis DSM 17918 TaxID=1121256 RepID=A0A1M5DDJ5_9THEO|nr:glycoside hydrolase family 97 N-terminal domain-containing protein [Caldanaerobius fijiensis]SHF64914.1 Glycosyl-hydrolase 97 N-terminal [Caldanaerobius fijiensis DSM 17918]
MLSNNSPVQVWDLKSPDSNIAVKVMLYDSGNLEYSVARNGQVIFENSPLGIITSVADFTSGLTPISFSHKTICESYPMVGAKSRYIKIVEMNSS